MTLKERYEQLSAREQLILRIAAVALVIFLSYVVVWKPLNDGISSKRATLVSQQEFLAEMTSKASQIAQLRQSGASGSQASFSGSLAQASNQLASRHQVTISRMQPRGDNLQIWVEQADFNQVVSWLSALENRGIHILDADFAESTQPGTIRVRSLVIGK